jgi:hypothetical protein
MVARPLVIIIERGRPRYSMVQALAISIENIISIRMKSKNKKMPKSINMPMV